MASFSQRFYCGRMCLWQDPLARGILSFGKGNLVRGLSCSCSLFYNLQSSRMIPNKFFLKIYVTFISQIEVMIWKYFFTNKSLKIVYPSLIIIEYVIEWTLQYNIAFKKMPLLHAMNFFIFLFFLTQEEVYSNTKKTSMKFSSTSTLKN